MKLTNVTKCRACGSTSLTWHTTSRVRNGIQQNRLNTSDVDCVFFLGCDDCSETLSVVSVDRVAAALNASAEPSAPVERDERAEFEAQISFAGLRARTKHGNYSYKSVESEWKGWQARAALERKSA